MNVPPISIANPFLMLNGKVQVTVVAATRIERCATARTTVPAIEIFGYAHLDAAHATYNGTRTEFGCLPHLNSVIRQLLMAKIARKPFLATLEENRYDIMFVVIVFATCLRVHLYPYNGHIVDKHATLFRNDIAF